jgi:zinc transport system permease protein
MFDFLAYSFIQNALIVGTIIGIIAPMVGIFLVVRGLSALADTLGHVSLVGIAIGLVTKINPIAVALVVSVVSSTFIERLRSSQKVKGESILVLFIAASLGISSVIISLSKGFSTSLISFLFGSINTISQSALYITLGFALLVVFCIIFFYKIFFTIAFDEELATSMGIKVSFYNTVLIILSAVVVSLGIQSVGVLLVSALMILPVITAQQYELSFKNTMFLGSLLGVCSVWLGIFLSFNLDIATGGTIVLINVLFFALSLLLNK